MIIVRAPFRVSFVGGGTDIAEFYRRERGAVVSTTIDKYVYITVNPNIGLHPYKYRIAYSVTENVNTIDEIQHPIVREALRLLEIDRPLEITNVADLPARAGLGSSSGFAVALLHALHALKGEQVTTRQLAEEAYHIEAEVLKRPVGKQDHYAIAYGGFNHIQFMPDESVHVDPVQCSRQTKAQLAGSLMMFFTGVTRDASVILKEQTENTGKKMAVLRSMRDMTEKALEILRNGDVRLFGELLHAGWTAKKTLADTISSATIDASYASALDAGAVGGKLLGAGGGGFLLLYAEKPAQEGVRKALKGLLELSFTFDDEGSTIVYADR